MQQDRLEGWMVRQIENADLAKETVIQLPRVLTAVQSPREVRHRAVPLHRAASPSTRQELSLSPSPCSPRRHHTSHLVSHQGPANGAYGADEGFEKQWRAQFHDRRQPIVEGAHVDRTKVLRNSETDATGHEDVSPLFLWGLPREHILEFIRQSVLPSSWVTNAAPRFVGEWEAEPSEEDEATHIHHAIANALAAAPPSFPRKPASPRAATSPHRASQIANHRASVVASPRVSSIGCSTTTSMTATSPRRVTPRSEDRISRFIAELRTDATLWAAFQRDVNLIQLQYRSKIRENKERAKLPRSAEEHEERKKQAEERMEHTRRQREKLIHIEEERLAAKLEVYQRRVDSSKQPLSDAELALTVRFRRRKMWLLVVSFAMASSRWHMQLIRAKSVEAIAKTQSKAAHTIQRLWRKWKIHYASKYTVAVSMCLRKCLWRLLLQIRCRRKAKHAMILQRFMLDHFADSRETRNFNRIMFLWRGNVIRAQKTGMTFVRCTRSRLQALSLWWDIVDHERQRMDRQLASNDDEGQHGILYTSRKDSMRGLPGWSGAPGSAGGRRGSITGAVTPAAPLMSTSSSVARTSSIAMLGQMDEKLANMQMLLTPIELQRLQQPSIQVVRVPKSIKILLLTQFLTAARKAFVIKQQAYKDQMLCASYARAVKLDEARAIVQSSVRWSSLGSASSDGNGRSVNPPPCFTLFSSQESAKAMEALVRRGVQLTLEADPELRALVAQQQQHRRPSVTFSAVPGAPSSSPSQSPRRSSISLIPREAQRSAAK